MLYEMAAGRRPFVAPTGLGVITSIVAEQPVPLTRLNAAIPIAFDDLVQRMLAQESRAASLGARRRTTPRRDAALAMRWWITPALAASARRTTVGREMQRVQLRRAYAGVREGRGVIVAVTGEPGIGKTSLIEDFLNELRPAAPRRRSRAAAAPSALPAPKPTCPCSKRSTASCTAAPAHSLDDADEGRGADVVSGGGETYARAGLAGRSCASTRRSRIAGADEARAQRAARRALARAAGRRLFIDDLHWADVSTIDMLNYLAGRLADMRVLVLASYRPSDMALAQHPFLGVRRDLQARGLFEEIPLPFLDVGDVERYLALQFPEPSLSARLRVGHSREDRRQPALHGRPRAVSARYRRHRRGGRRDGSSRARWRMCRATCPNRCAA